MTAPTPDTEPYNPTDDDTRSRVTCSCGWEATSHDDDQLRYMHEDHRCGNRSWLSPVFSVWGFLIVLVLALLAEEIFAGVMSR